MESLRDVLSGLVNGSPALERKDQVWPLPGPTVQGRGQGWHGGVSAQLCEPLSENQPGLYQPHPHLQGLHRWGLPSAPGRPSLQTPATCRGPQATLLLTSCLQTRSFSQPINHWLTELGKALYLQLVFL